MYCVNVIVLLQAAILQYVVCKQQCATKSELFGDAFHNKLSYITAGKDLRVSCNVPQVNHDVSISTIPPPGKVLSHTVFVNLL